MIPSSGNCGLLLNLKLKVRKKEREREREREIKTNLSLFPQGIYPAVGLLGHMVV